MMTYKPLEFATYVRLACMIYGKNVYFENCKTTNAAANRFVYVRGSDRRIRSTYKSNLILNNNALKTLAVKRIY